MKLTKISGTLLAFLCLLGGAFGQETTGSIEGTCPIRVPGAVPEPSARSDG